MSFIGALTFYTKFIEKLHINLKPFYDLLHENTFISIEKPKYYQVHDINTLLHNVTHAYHPEITEIFPQTNYSSQYKYVTTSLHQFSLHQVYMTNQDITTTNSLYNVQPTAHTSKNRVFPSLPYTKENLKFINKFNFQFSDLTDTDFNTL